MCRRVSPALMKTGRKRWRVAMAATSAGSRSSTTASATANFTPPPPAGRKSRRYSRSITASQASSGTGGTSIASILLLRDEADGEVVVLRPVLVEGGEALGALG